MKKLPDTFAVIILLTGLAIACARILAGCTPAQTSAGLDVAGHSAALAVCRAEGKDAGSYSVYGRCADEADRKYGVSP